jgi:rhodanese-related sulfurtransferase
MKSLSPDALRALGDSGGVDVIDVREPHEWIGGHLPGARLVPLGAFLRDPRGNVRGNRAVFVCAHGLRSVTAAVAAESAGVPEVFNLDGGIVWWVARGLPLAYDSHE